MHPETRVVLSTRKSTVGRPRVLTVEKVNMILAWHDAVRAWSAQRKTLKTLRQLAKELGVPRSTAYDVISLRGQYKRAAAEPACVDGATRGAMEGEQ